LKGKASRIIILPMTEPRKQVVRVRRFGGPEERWRWSMSPCQRRDVHRTTVSDIAFTLAQR
jgi:hypothetical protein